MIFNGEFKAVMVFIILIVLLTTIQNIVCQPCAYDKALYAGQSNKWQEARDTLCQLVMDNPTCDQIAYDAGVAAYRAGDVSQSIAYFEQALTCTNDIPLKEKIYFNCGNAYAHIKELSLALASYQHALDINPNNEQTRHNYETIKKLLEEQEKQEQDQDNQKKSDNQDDESSDDENQKQSNESDHSQQSNENEQSDSDNDDQQQNQKNQDKQSQQQENQTNKNDQSQQQNQKNQQKNDQSQNNENNSQSEKSDASDQQNASEQASDQDDQPESEEQSNSDSNEDESSHDNQNDMKQDTSDDDQEDTQNEKTRDHRHDQDESDDAQEESIEARSDDNESASENEQCQQNTPSLHEALAKEENKWILSLLEQQEMRDNRGNKQLLKERMKEGSSSGHSEHNW